MLPISTQEYETRSSMPILDALPESQRSYLAAAARVADTVARASKAADIAKAPGKEQTQTSTTRQTLIKSGLLVAPTRGGLMFNVPYLRDYLLRDEPENSEPPLRSGGGFEAGSLRAACGWPERMRRLLVARFMPASPCLPWPRP